VQKSTTVLLRTTSPKVWCNHTIRTILTKQAFAIILFSIWVGKKLGGSFDSWTDTEKSNTGLLLTISSTYCCSWLINGLIDEVFVTHSSRKIPRQSKEGYWKFQGKGNYQTKLELSDVHDGQWEFTLSHYHNTWSLLTYCTKFVHN